MVLCKCNSSHHGIAADDVEWTRPAPFTFREQSMRPWRWSVSQECYVDVDEVHDRKQKEGRHRSVVLKSEKPAMEDGECLRPCCNGKASQENSKVEDQKSQESSETIQPKTTLPSVKWELTGITIPVKKKKRHQKLSCEICQVQATSEHSLQEHRAGRKHQLKEAIDQKVQLTEESSSSTEQKTSSIKWSCSTCQANGTSESDLKEHLNGRTHRQNIKAQLMESDGIAKTNELQEPECPKNNAPQHSEKPPPMSSTHCLANSTHELELRGHLLAKPQALLDEISNLSRNSESREATVLPNIAPQHTEQTPGSNCSILQADSDCKLDLEHQFGAKIHQLNVQDLLEEAKKTGDFPPEIAKDQQPPSEWGCVICQAKCYSAPQFAQHCRGKKHQKKVEALQGGVDAKSSNLTTVHKAASNGPDCSSSSSEKVEDQTALWSCGVCNVQCNSESMLAGHCKEEEHMEKQKLRDFCEVCNLKCNSEKMLAHHLSGSKHQKRLSANKRNAVVAWVPVALRGIVQ
ncbi:zinc finger protein 385B-like isoform X3 [Zea mays]|nr:zinc finger protein 385B-like isoform X4 [Zea mays]XP_035816909.1 zinc finger protein 385B-like isoform X4 [Zea mays]XP_035816912.1 zinc finger protein 385B-like isoform X3 [Zea mays]XP_035816913.1 zinc finger protein 385B-like isoform X3 [Zea mays]